MYSALLVVLIYSLVQVVHSQLNRDAAEYVNPLIGTLNGGHVFAGASTPSGSVKPGADSKSKDNQAGYVSDGSPIYGFSQLHDDGTGGSASLGISQLFPQFCILSETQQQQQEKSDKHCRWTKESRATLAVNGSTVASPGFFGIDLVSGIRVTITSTDHVALYHFNFTQAFEDDSTDLSPTVLLDLTDDLNHSYQWNSGKLDIHLSEEIQGTKNARVTGSGEWRPSFGAGTYQMHSCADFVDVQQVGTYETSQYTKGKLTINDAPQPSGALIQFDRQFLAQHDNIAPVRIGMSWVSVENACKFIDTEIPSLQALETFEHVQQQSRQAWDRIFDSLAVDMSGVKYQDRVLFWSSLYRTFLAPLNVTGDNPLYQSSEPVFDSLYCLWDTARVVHPIWAILEPHAQAQVVRSVIENYRQLGYMPECRMSTNKGFTQGGSNAEMLLSDAYVKGIRDGINWEDGLKAMLKDATVEPQDWGLEGRGAIDARKKYGYVPRGTEGNPSTTYSWAGRTASRLLEYAYNDLSIGLVAAGLKKKTLYQEYIQLSKDSFHLWNPNIESDGFHGFMQARFANGSFHYQDPRMCSPAYQFGCYLDRAEQSDFYEASAWQYSLFVPHDMQSMVKLMGGDQTFIKRMDHMWDMNYADDGDEPGFLPAFAYNFAKGGYSHTVDRTLEILHKNFNTSLAGIPGNDDSGAMASFVVWEFWGMFPVAGTGIYLLSTPQMAAYSITSKITGKTLTVKTRNFDGATNNKYIVSATVNDGKWTKNWICHSLFLDGGEIELVLGNQPSNEFGMSDQDLPPALSTGGFSYDSAFLGC